MKINKVSWKTKDNFIKQMEQKKKVIIGNLELPLKQTIIWFLTASHNRVYLRRENERFRLVGYDIYGMRLDCPREKVLSLMNPDVKELVLPEKFICQTAKEELEKIENRLVLTILNYRENQPFESNGATLKIGVDSKTGLTYGLLVLNH